MRWDIVFFVRGYPAECRIRDAHYFMIAVDAAELERLAKVDREQFPDQAVFFDPKHPEEFTAVGFRTEAEDQNAAIESALRFLHGIFDGTSLLLGHQLPRVGPIMVREGGDDDATLCTLVDSQWTYFDSHDETSAAWAHQAQKIFRHFWPFFDVIAGVHANSATPLAQQLVYSMQRYRRGAIASLAGVEFICKWSALEGIVSIGESPKRQKITERLELLFIDRRAEIPALVKRLWKIRNDAVHEARVSAVAEPIYHVDELFLGVAAFAVAHLDRADSVDGLWLFAPNFVLPDFVKTIRPGRARIDIGTMPAARAVGRGQIIESLFAVNARTLANPGETPV